MTTYALDIRTPIPDRAAALMRFVGDLSGLAELAQSECAILGEQDASDARVIVESHPPFSVEVLS